MSTPPQEQLSRQDPTSPGPDPVFRLRRRGVLVTVFVAMFAVVGLYAADSSLPDNALELPGQDKAAVRSVIPQGWAFFTRNPKEPELRMWRPGSGQRWTAFSLGENASPSAFFGASRRPRALNIEMGLIYTAGQELKAPWLSCNPNGSNDSLETIVNACLAGTPVGQRVRNDAPAPTLCGSVALTAQEPLPWSWARSGVTEQMPVRVTRLEVTC